MQLKSKFLLFFVLFSLIGLQAQEAQPEPTQTLTYFTNDSISLELDLFIPDHPGDDLLPLLIYVHGGGFSAGDRFGGYKLAQ